MSEEKTTKKQKYIQATGRRKTSTARVRIWDGTGNLKVNDVDAYEYFEAVGQSARLTLEKPFSAIGRRNKFDATIHVIGGGVHSQIGAVVHGIARALDKYNTEDFHRILKKNDLLTRDPRMKERRKFGLMGARKKKASPKR